MQMTTSPFALLLVAFIHVNGDGINVNDALYEAAVNQPGDLLLLQVEKAIGLNATSEKAELDDGVYVSGWMPLVRIPLFSVILMVAHGWLFRPWKSLFLVLIPVVLAAVPADLEGVSDNRDRQFVLAKTFSVAIILEFGTAVCVAYAPQQAAWPLSGFVYRCCAYLKGYHWPWMFLYLGLCANILEAVLLDLANQNYSNPYPPLGIILFVYIKPKKILKILFLLRFQGECRNVAAGLLLIASTPLPGTWLFQYPMEMIRKYGMTRQADLQGQDATEDEVRARVSDWHIALMEHRGSTAPFGDLCCRLPLSWVWLYTSWNGCVLFKSLDEKLVALLLAPLLESFRIRYVQQRHGVALNPWEHLYWLQARTFSLWLWTAFQGPFHQVLATHMISTPTDWFHLTAEGADRAHRFWGAFNLVGTFLHVIWYWHRVYQLSRGEEKGLEAAAETADG